MTTFGLVLTNWHVVRDAAGQVGVIFPDGFRSAATVARIDRDWDLAALVVWRPNVAPIPVASQPPRPGDMLTIAGYGSGPYRAVSGRCTEYVAPAENLPYEMVELDAPARQGDSGGPILNSRGELAGVLFGTGFGRTTGSYCGRVRWFLASVEGDFQRLSGEMTQARQARRDPPPLAAIPSGPPAAATQPAAQSARGAIGFHTRTAAAAPLRLAAARQSAASGSHLAGVASTPARRFVASCRPDQDDPGGDWCHRRSLHRPAAAGPGGGIARVAQVSRSNDAGPRDYDPPFGFSACRLRCGSTVSCQNLSSLGPDSPETASRPNSVAASFVRMVEAHYVALAIVHEQLKLRSGLNRVAIHSEDPVKTIAADFESAWAAEIPISFKTPKIADHRRPGAVSDHLDPPKHSFCAGLTTEADSSPRIVRPQLPGAQPAG